jgi:uncharacterized MAPEG superfamily protein
MLQGPEVSVVATDRLRTSPTFTHRTHAHKTMSVPSVEEFLPVGLVVTAYGLMAIFDTVGAAKGREVTGTEAPRMDGPEFFLRTQRAQMNNVEQGHYFLPALLTHAVCAGPRSAAVAGAAWVALRCGYSFSYRSGLLKPKQLGVFTVPCYLLLAYLGYGPAYAGLRTWGKLSHGAAIGTLVGFHAALFTAIHFYTGHLEAVARREGVDKK